MDSNLTPLALSLKVALISTAVVFLSGLVMARFLTQKEFWGKNMVESLLLLPLVLPPTVVGFGLLLAFGKNGFLGKWLSDVFGLQIVFTLTGAVIASVVVSFPLMYQSAQAAFSSIDRRLEDAARTMGASEWRLFWTVSFPLAWPGLLAGLVLSFARGLGEFGATLMLAGYIPGKTDTIPVAIYFAVEAGQMDKAMFWVIVIVALGLCTTVWLNWWSRRHLRRYAYKK
ncbi:molybdate ABC transporter permease subunit [Brevibacillus composti]|uniref:Molybdenum transport system permease n=1 Tax=Brevibacillus composti TaxID=2796470 RepID=A0A7T5JMF3_9BACL|nr:molybdate ABC transporter permease subunit [Brevibacillus composti]QQE72930.1 molybdate ABC transporter permease subunit [Brevibacillus composti]QUO40008.1 molybdate ABC transporter permease subunit [Brevibacillus composti]